MNEFIRSFISSGSEIPSEGYKAFSRETFEFHIGFVLDLTIASAFATFRGRNGIRSFPTVVNGRIC